VEGIGFRCPCSHLFNRNAEHEAEEEESKLNLEKAREGRDISEIDVEEIPSLGLIIQQTKEERKEKRKRAASNSEPKRSLIHDLNY
jgi:hypothetical protein